jgi:hypothetical protein
MRLLGEAGTLPAANSPPPTEKANKLTPLRTPHNAGPVDLVGWSYSGPIVMLVVLQLVHSLTIHEPSSVIYITDPAIAKVAGDDGRAALGSGESNNRPAAHQ